MSKKNISEVLNPWFLFTILVLSILIGGTANAQQPTSGFPYTDSFKFPTSPGTILGGTNGNSTTVYSAFLTASATAVTSFGSVGGNPPGVSNGTNSLTTADADGGGYLRLTRTVTNQTGFGRNTRTFPSSQGLSISFEYYTYGGTADGIVFSLFDADVVNRSAASTTAVGYNGGLSGFQIGQFGGSIGYAQRNDVVGGGGMSRGFLGIAFDEFGNFGVSGGAQGRQGGYVVSPSRTADWITLRGDGDGTGASQPGFGAGTNYEYLVGVNTANGIRVNADASTSTVTMGGGTFNIASPAAPASRTAGFATTDNGYRKARIIIEFVNASLFTINVYVDANTGAGMVTRHVIQNYSYVPNSAAPANLSYSFSSSTGNSTNVHEIRAIDISAPSSVAFAPVSASATVSTLEDNAVSLSLIDYAYDQNGNTQLNWATGLDLDPTQNNVQASRTIPGQGTFTSNASGTVTFTPVANYNGTATTDFTIADFGNAIPTIAVATSNPASLTITVTPVNDPPITTSKTVTTNEDVPYIFTAADFALTDAFDTPHTLDAVQITTLPATGTLLLSGAPVSQGASITLVQINSASFTYLPPTNTSASPTTSFTFRVRDTGGITNGGIDVSLASATMTINVLPSNDPPAGIDKSITINEDAPYTFQVIDFDFTDAFDNPSPNGLLSVIVSPLGAGSLTIAGVPIGASQTIASASITSLVYTPPLNASGTPTTTFTFQVRDNGGILNGGVDLDQSPNTITINVNAINDAPVANPDVNTVTEDVTLTVASAAGLLSNDTDVENTTLTISQYFIAGDLVAKAIGTPVVITGVGTINIAANGGYSFIPVANYTGTIPVITYTATDGALTATSTLTLSLNPVNDAPVANPDVNTVTEDVTLTVVSAAGLLSNDTDVENTTLTISQYFIAGDLVAKAIGTPVVITGVGTINIAANGGYSFIPVANYTGTIPVITYTATDGALTATSTLTLSLTAVNDEPSFTKGANQIVNENAAAQTVSAWATSISKGPANEVSQTLIFTVTNDNNALFLTQPGIDPITGNLTYTLAANKNGIANISIVLSDNGGTANFGDDIFATQTFTITVNPAPVITMEVTDPTICLGLNATITLKNSVAGINYQLRNDIGNSLVGSVVPGTGGDISFIILPGATTTYNILATNIATSASGMVTDKSTVTVNTLPLTPTASIVGGGSSTACVNVGVPLTSSSATGNQWYKDGVLIGGATSQTYSAVASGTYTVTVTTSGCSSAASNGTAVTITLLPTTPTVSIVGGGSSTACVNVGVPLTSNSVTGNQWYRDGVLIVGATNQLFNADATAAYSVVVTAGGCSSAPSTSLAVIINPLPTASISYSGSPFCATGTTNVIQGGTGGGTYSSTTGLSINSTTGAINLSASTAGTYTVTYSTSNSGGCLSTATASVTINALPSIAAIAGVSNLRLGSTTTLSNTVAGGTWASSNTGVATINSSGLVTGISLGTTTITYTVISGGCLNSITKLITVTNINTPPVAVADTYSTTRGATLTVSGAGVLSNDTDVDGNSLTAIQLLDPSNGTVSLNLNGSFTYTHNGGTSTFDSFTYKVSDGTVDGNTVTVSINIAPSANSAPVAQIDSYNVSHNTLTTISAPGVLGNDTDINNNPMTAIKVTNPTHGTLTFNSNGSFTYLHNGGTATSDSFTYKVNDGLVDGNTVVVTLNILHPNAAPVAVADNYTTTKGATLTVSAPGVLFNDTDADNNSLTAIKVSNPTNGILTLNSNGSFTYVHDNGSSTSDSFAYKVNDGTIDGNIVTVTISIATPGVAPVIADINKSGFKNQDVPFTLLNFSEKFVDILHTIQKVKIVSLPPSGTLKLNGVNITAGQEIAAADLEKITFTPLNNFVGIVSFLYSATCTGGLPSLSKNVNITILEPGIAPIAVADSYTVIRGATLTLALPGVLKNDTDPDGHPLTAIKVTDPANGSLILNSNGSFTYVHNGNAATSDSFTYKANDGFLDGNTVTVTLNIPIINLPPVLSSFSKSGNNALPIPFTLANFVEKFTDTDSLVRIKIVTLPTTGILKLYGNPVLPNQEIGEADIKGLTFEPPLHWNGSVSFLWNASDGSKYALNNASVNIQVTQPSDPNAKIGLAKQLASVTPNLNGSYDLKFIFTVVNYGTFDLQDISVRDNLALAFGGAEVSVKLISGFGNLKANTSFNGFSDTELLLNSSRLVGGEEAKIELLVNVRLLLTGGIFQNTATAEALSHITGFKVTDVSTNGLKPDPNVAADVSPSEVTTIKLDLLPTYVPPGFSPNGDGINDKFVVQNADGKLVSLEMYNRWGNRVYRSKDYRNDWGGEVTEGFFLGKDIPDGTYYYIIIIDNKDRYAGFITVNR